MGNWWEERAALLNEAVELISSQADCTLDAALLLLKLRARAVNWDLEDMASAVLEHRVRFSSECLTDHVTESDTQTCS